LLQTGSWKLWSLERSPYGLLLTGRGRECKQWTGENSTFKKFLSMLPTIESLSKHSRCTVIRNVACSACDSSASADTELCRCNRINWETDTTDAQCTPQTPCRHRATRQFSSRCELSMTLTIRLDTIRDAILTCAQRKPTWVSLIYRTETTTKSGKQKN